MKISYFLIGLFMMTGLCAAAQEEVTVGAARTDQYVEQLQGKRIALFSNHTGVVGDRHTVDVMLSNGLNVTLLLSPEHGFRGTADAGEHVASGVDAQTGIAVFSLYNPGGPGIESVVDQFDVIVCDIQDVGLRFYTYYCTMLKLMRTASTYDKAFVVFDRPNPNGMTVDGPILDMQYESGVGRLPIPILHGLTLGEMAQMIIGEGWLKTGKDLSLTVIPCLGYTHQTRYTLPVVPSPNLRTMHAIYLYASTCYFEGTPVSLGRGTDAPFEIYGHPDYKGGTFEFTPRSVPGAKNPPQLNKLCHGVDLRGIADEDIIARGVDLSYLIDAYHATNLGEAFFTRFFEKLIGRGDIRQMIMDGKSADEIKATWADEVERFKEQRRPYLLYAE